MLLRLKMPLILAVFLFSAFLMQVPSPARADSNVQWIKYSGNPILGPTLSGWDSEFALAPTVLFDGSTYRMWYVGGNATAVAIGYANSTDGFTWRKYPDPVLSPGSAGSWDSSAVGLGSVIWNGTLFLMWYRGGNSMTFANGAVGLAFSRDGISWSKYSANPVLTVTTAITPITIVGRVCVIRWQATYYMWASGRSASDQISNHTRIYYATSNNGVNWTIGPSAAISPSTNATAWDSQIVYGPSVIQAGSNFGLWYSGISQGSHNPQIGYANSQDLVTWTKDPGNPILSEGSSDSWDAGGVEQPVIIFGANGYALYYDGFNATSHAKIGLALPPQNFKVPELPIPEIGLLALVLAAVVVFHIHRRRKRIEPD